MVWFNLSLYENIELTIDHVVLDPLAREPGSRISTVIHLTKLPMSPCGLGPTLKGVLRQVEKYTKRRKREESSLQSLALANIQLPALEENATGEGMGVKSPWRSEQLFGCSVW